MFRVFSISLVLVFSALVLLMLVRRAHTHIDQEDQNTQMYSVSIKNRVITLASKSNNGYQLPYLDASVEVHQCDPVYFTGLDGLQDADEFVGYVSEVENKPMSRYMIVNVSNNLKCSGS